jgi:hypothetical protein
LLPFLTAIVGFTREKVDNNFSNDQSGIPNNKLTLKDKKMINDTMNMVITRIFDAPVEKVWKAWSEEELLKQWWGLNGLPVLLLK